MSLRYLYRSPATRMLHFYGKRVFHRLQPLPLGPCKRKGPNPSEGNVTSQRLILQIDRGSNRYFTCFNSIYEFTAWYKHIPESDRTCNEVIVSDMRKLVIDIDNPDDSALQHMLYFYDIKRHVLARIRQVLHTFTFDITPEILVYNMTKDGHISFHFVITNYAFRARTCYGLCELISAKQLWEPLVDKGVYKSVQMMRIEGSTKFGQKRRKPFIDMENSLLGNVYSNHVKHYDLDITVTTPHATRGYSSWTSGCVIPCHFIIRKRTATALLLDRIRPAMCVQCKRVHTSENAIIINPQSANPMFICWRFYATMLANS